MCGLDKSEDFVLWKIFHEESCFLRQVALEVF